MFLEAGTAEQGVERWMQSASVLHPDGDAFDFAVREGRIVGVRGTASDRINRGRLGPKDLFGCRQSEHRTGCAAPSCVSTESCARPIGTRRWV
jgi:hypothetical protein